MENAESSRRLLFRVILKVLVLSGIAFFVWILINSLSASFPEQSVNKLPIVELDISDMQKGFIRKTQWNGKEVAVLYRPDTSKNPSKTVLEETDHSNLNEIWRSHRTDYFVYINSSNCPLYYSQRVFKDICTQKRFDESGREINIKNKPTTLAIPPHYFTEKKVVFGRWHKDKS